MTARLRHESSEWHPIISLNGHLVSPDDLLLSPLDRGFTLGDGIFETMKVANGIVWYMGRHLDRLSYGAARLGITVPTELRQWIGQVVQSTELIDSYGLRVVLTRGVTQTHGLAGNNTSQPTIAITTFGLPERQRTLNEQGLRTLIAPNRRYEQGATVGIKTTNYLESVLALREAITAGYDDVIFLDTRGFLSEASASNIFLWSNGRLATPSSTCGILPGITRAVILELAKQAGIPTAEQEIPADYLYLAEEIFLTSSIREIVPVTRVNGRLIGAGIPGPTTRRLVKYYDSTTERV